MVPDAGPKAGRVELFGGTPFGEQKPPVTIVELDEFIVISWRSQDRPAI